MPYYSVSDVRVEDGKRIPREPKMDGRDMNIYIYIYMCAYICVYIHIVIQYTALKNYDVLNIYRPGWKTIIRC
jgi:hypothetical protein